MHHTVIALSETEVVKLFAGETRSDIGSEAEKMRAANGINGLVVRFGRLDVRMAAKGDLLSTVYRPCIRDWFGNVLHADRLGDDRDVIDGSLTSALVIEPPFLGDGDLADTVYLEIDNFTISR